MYKQKLVFDDQIFNAEVALPVIGTDSGAKEGSIGLRCGGQEGRLAATLRAGSKGCTLKDGKTITLTLSDCDTETGTYAAVAPATSLVLTGPTGGQAYGVNEEVMSMIIPKGVRKFVKMKIVCTNDTNPNEGNVNMHLEYLAN